MWWLLWAGLALAGFYGLHRLALWVEGRGWIHYRHHRMPAGAAALALMEAASIVHPQVEHVVEEARSRRAQRQQDESGEAGPEGP